MRIQWRFSSVFTSNCITRGAIPAENTNYRLPCRQNDRCKEGLGLASEPLGDEGCAHTLGGVPERVAELRNEAPLELLLLQNCTRALLLGVFACTALNIASFAKLNKPPCCDDAVCGRCICTLEARPASHWHSPLLSPPPPPPLSLSLSLSPLSLSLSLSLSRRLQLRIVGDPHLRWRSCQACTRAPVRRSC